MINTPYKELKKGPARMHPALQFLVFALVFVGVWVISIVIGGVAVVLIYGSKAVANVSSLNTSGPHFVIILWILQLVSMTMPILVAALVFAYIVMRDGTNYIKPTFRFPWLLIPLVLAVMVFSEPVIQFLSNLNQQMVLPKFLHWMRDSEDQAQKLTEALLQMNTIWDMIMDVLLVGLLTAIVEEFMFRGVMQTIFLRWTKNHHAAIWITAILFSAFHMEFFGFLPRLMLGVLFGYFVAWSGSIWPAVFAHFLNNGSAVAFTYFYQKKTTALNPDDAHLFNYQLYIPCLLIMLFLLFIYKKTATQKSQIADY